MRFIYAFSYVVSAFVARIAQIVFVLTCFGTAAMTAAAVVAAYGVGLIVFGGLHDQMGVAALVPAVGAGVALTLAAALASMLLVGITKAVSKTTTRVAVWFSSAAEEAFAPAPVAQAKPEPQLELPLPAVEREPNRRVPRRDVEPFPRAAH